MGSGVHASPHATLLTFRHSPSPPLRSLNHFQLNIILLGAYVRPLLAHKFSRLFNVFFHGPTGIILLFFLRVIHRQRRESAGERPSVCWAAGASILPSPPFSAISIFGLDPRMSPGGP